MGERPARRVQLGVRPNLVAGIMQSLAWSIIFICELVSAKLPCAPDKDDSLA